MIISERHILIWQIACRKREIINHFGAAALKALEISDLSGLCLIFKVSIPDSSAATAFISSVKGNILVSWRLPLNDWISATVKFRVLYSPETV